jgi:hypothetical protein
MSGRSEQRERARRGERRAASGARAAQAPGGGRGAGGALTKVVLARRSDVRFRGRLDPLALLATLQARGLTAPLVTHAGPASTHTFKCSACGSPELLGPKALCGPETIRHQCVRRFCARARRRAPVKRAGRHEPTLR